MNTNLNMNTPFDPGFNCRATSSPFGFAYGDDVFGPPPEIRTLDSIRPSLREPDCDGPHEVYAIAMDVGRERDRGELQQRHLLYGAVTYAAGRLGREPIRSQGHVHKVSPLSGWSTPEVYEIWQGRACILMQESDGDDPGRCFAVFAGPGEVVIVPPGWAHATISADPDAPLTFGAFCDRAYGFVYDGVRAHKGMAYFPLLSADGSLEFEANSRYQSRPLTQKPPRHYTELGLQKEIPLYTQYTHQRDRFDFVPRPQLRSEAWVDFEP